MTIVSITNKSQVSRGSQTSNRWDIKKIKHDNYRKNAGKEKPNINQSNSKAQ